VLSQISGWLGQPRTRQGTDFGVGKLSD